MLTMKLSMEYLNIIFLGSIFIFIQMAVNSSLTAMGDTKTNRNVLIVSFFLNIFLNPLFIFGYWNYSSYGNERYSNLYYYFTRTRN